MPSWFSEVAARNHHALEGNPGGAEEVGNRTANAGLIDREIDIAGPDRAPQKLADMPNDCRISRPERNAFEKADLKHFGLKALDRILRITVPFPDSMTSNDSDRGRIVRLTQIDTHKIPGHLLEA